MLLNHIILAVLWILYGLLHSLFAASRFKQAVQGRLGRHVKYYTFGYSVFAMLSLAGVLIYQIAIPSVLLWTMPLWAQLLMLLPTLVALYIMAALIKKYFFALSGISAFYKKQAPVVLELGGWNRYMRHPLYFGTLLFIWSLFFIFPLLSNLIGCAVITIYTIAGTILEERKLVDQFGEAYSDYRQRVPMIVPTWKKRL